MSRPIGMAHPVDMANDVTLNQFRLYEDSDDTDYWIDIQGYRIPLTEKQFIALHEARIQLWDKATEYAEKRIIKLLESKICSCLDLPDDQTFADREELMKHMNCDWQAMQIEYHLALIKGEQK